MRAALKSLIFITIGLSLLGGFIPEAAEKLALSWAGIQQLHLWEFATYIFVERGPFSFHFFVQLAFNMYILWMFGSSLVDRIHARPFLTLYFGSAIVGGLAALAFPHPVLAGSTNAVYSVLVAWMMLNPGSQLLLFFTVPFKAHWLIAALIGLSLFLDLSSSHWLGGATLAASLIFSYFFTLITWRQMGPFVFLNPFERKILRLFETKEKPYHHSKIYDIKSGTPVLDDDQFMDAMLDQISRLGEGSLTSAEKKRMREISERKQ